MTPRPHGRAHLRTLGWLWLLGGATPACVPAPTQIVVRLETDMTQGPSGVLHELQVRIDRPENAPEIDRLYVLADPGGGRRLPVEFTLTAGPGGDVPRAVGLNLTPIGDDGPMFVSRVVLTYRPGRVALARVVLANRCRDPNARVACASGSRGCPSGECICGAVGCEDVARDDLPLFTPTADAGAD